MYDESFQETIDLDSIGSQQEVSAYLREHYPNLALALSGRVGSKKAKTSPIPPATIIIFARDGGIGFVIAPKDSAKNAHGFIDEGLELVSQIEEAIASRRIGWKPAKRK